MDENIPDDIVPVSFEGAIYMPHPAEDKLNSCTDCAFHSPTAASRKAVSQCYKTNCISDAPGQPMFIFKADKPA